MITPPTSSPECPGILFVTIAPSASLPRATFHEWYNNEHGPLRLRLPHIFPRAARYQREDKDDEFLAVYDVSRMQYLQEEVYTSLRTNRSNREGEVIGQCEVKRYFYDDFGKVGGEDIWRDGVVLAAWEVKVKDGRGEKLEAWLEGTFVNEVQRATGWIGSRFFKTSTLEDGGSDKYLILSYFEPETAPKAVLLDIDICESTNLRTFKQFYTFGPGPRDLESLSQMPAESKPFTSDDRLTRTAPGSSPHIESFVALPDGLIMPYRLEGNPAPDSPVILFCNSLLTSARMWAPLIEILKKERPEFRLLSYDSRGRHAVPHPPQPSTLDILSEDIKHLLSALRIPNLHALIGVSMGGATTLNFAMKYPSKLERFVACDFNATSSDANTQAWKERTATAEENSGQGIKTLATATVKRWFSDKSMAEEQVAKGMEDMVAANHVEGFRYGCQALWDYDLKPKMGECDVPGLFVVGEEDGKGKLVEAMKGFNGKLGKTGGDLRIVTGCGHLPMWENAPDFWATIQNFI